MKQIDNTSNEELKSEDFKLFNDLNAALQKEKHTGLFSIIIFILIFLLIFITWAYFSSIEEVTRGQGSIIPSSREQIIQSLDPGVIAELNVSEGDEVKKGQVLLRLDDTRSSAILRESEAKVANLEAMIARLQAEAYGSELVFPSNMMPDLVKREQAAYKARKQALEDSVSGRQISKATLDREIAITAPMVNEGVMSEVELLRMKRESADLTTQILDLKNQYSVDANNELVKALAELAQAKENVAMRSDPVERALIRAPMRGIVKNIRINTIGGVVSAGQDILEIVPLGDNLLVEAYIRPEDVAFVRPGLPAIVKISAYDYSIYGGLEGEVKLISPGTLQDQKRPSDLKLNSNEAYYRVLVETKNNTIKDKDKKDMPIIPGMIAVVDIKTGEKTVFQYLTKPITRLKQALRER